jgi:hypothetical protein
VNRSTIGTAAVILGLGLSLVGCGTRPDPCTTAGLPAPSPDQISKVERGLEVDESIEVNGYELECELVQDRAGAYTWVSESDD